METRGFYYDGETSARHAVFLRLEGKCLRWQGEGIAGGLPLEQVKLSAPLGATCRSIYFPDGGKCEIADGPFADTLSRALGGGGFARRLHRWERSLKRVAVALLLAVAVVWGFIQHGIPLLAERAARAVPPATAIALEREALQVLEKMLFHTTELPESRQEELNLLFSDVVGSLGDGRDYRLLFRKAPALGPNAFALPGGAVVLTDELVALAAHDEEIAAVLAHEVGHIRHRHALRQVIQNSAAGLLVATLTGDVFSATSLAATLPTVLVDAKFSRRMEGEADEVAIAYLRREGISLERFASLLTRLEEAHRDGSGAGDDEGEIADYFSTHPATRERLERLRAAAGG